MALISCKKKMKIWSVGTQDFEDECSAVKFAEVSDMDIVYTPNKLVTVYKYHDATNNECWTIDSLKASSEEEKRANEKMVEGKKLLNILGKVFKVEKASSITFYRPIFVINHTVYSGRVVVVERVEVYYNITDHWSAKAPQRTIETDTIEWLSNHICTKEHVSSIEEINKAVSRGQAAFKKIANDIPSLEKIYNGTDVTSHYTDKYGVKQ